VKKKITLADCTVPIRLRCMHCIEDLPSSALIEVFENYVVVECPKCKCATPFKLEKSA
jgi:phage FluMu protein Com